MSKKFSNRKIRIISLISAVAVCAVLCAVLCACNPKTPASAPDNSPCYDISAVYDAQSHTLSVSQEILYTAPDALDEVVLHVYANAFAKNNDAIEILSAQINRQNVDFEIYGSDKTLMKLPCDLTQGDTCTLSFKYKVTIPQSDTRLGITEHGDANLTCFYPVIAKYDGAWREDCYAAWGDPFFCDASSFYVRVTADENLTVAASGRTVETVLKDVDGQPKKTVEIEAENVRDFGMAIGGFKTVSDTLKLGDYSVAVNYCYYDDAAPSETLQRAKQSLEVFSQAFGDYPHSTFTVVQSNLGNAGGMEYGSFVLVSPSSSREEYLDTVTHETAHQWWYNAVGSDQINSAWLDEGLTEFCTYYFHYLTGNRSAYNEAMASLSRSYSSFSALKNTVGFDGTMNRPLSSYLTEGEYVAVTYLKGALLFDALRSLVGDKKFQGAMRQYYADNIYGVATQTDLIEAFKSQGYDISSIVIGWVNDTVLM